MNIAVLWICVCIIYGYNKHNVYICVKTSLGLHWLSLAEMVCVAPPQSFISYSCFLYSWVRLTLNFNYSLQLPSHINSKEDTLKVQFLWWAICGRERKMTIPPHQHTHTHTNQEKEKKTFNFFPTYNCRNNILKRPKKIGNCFYLIVLHHEPRIISMLKNTQRNNRNDFDFQNHISIFAMQKSLCFWFHKMFWITIFV